MSDQERYAVRWVLRVSRKGAGGAAWTVWHLAAGNMTGCERRVNSKVREMSDDLGKVECAWCRCVLHVGGLTEEMRAWNGAWYEDQLR